MAMPSVLAYSDYRLFLKAYAEHKQASSPYWSLHAWARKLQVASVSTLSMILNKRRHAGPCVTEKFLAYFRFDVREREHFLDLVQLGKRLDNPKLIVHLLQEKSAARAAGGAAPGALAPGSSAPSTAPNSWMEVGDFVSTWLTYVLREVVSLDDFNEDAAWIAQRIKVPTEPAQVRRALDRLLEQGFIRRDASGKLVPQDATVSAQALMTPQKIASLHREILGAASAAVSVPPEARALHAAFMGVRRDRLPQAKRLIERFHRRFEQLIEAPNGEEVYQLNVQFFPVTDRLGSA